MISVIIPVYNTEKYLQDCIDCLLAQTIQDMEFLFVNDASKDGSLTLLRKNEAEHPDKIRVIDSPENLRQGGARNLGIRAARGEYIGFVDSDDLISPDMYERLYRAIREYHVTTAFAWMEEVPDTVSIGEMMAVRDDLAHPDWADRITELSDHELSDQERIELMSMQIGGSVTWLYRRDFLIENDLFFPEHVSYEDNYWWPLAMGRITSVHFVDFCCYFYRRNDASTTCRRNNPRVYDRITLEDRMLEEFKRRGLYERCLPALEYGYITRRTFMTYGFLMYTFDDPPFSDMKKLMHTLRERFPEWRKNTIYTGKHSSAERLKNLVKYRFPVLYAKAMLLRHR